MKTLRIAKDKEEIVRRVQTILPTSQRRWGRMSAHQMICHLSDSYRMFMGDKKVAPVGGLYPSALLRWFALGVPTPWPRGFRAAPELDQQIGGTRPVQFDADVSELLALIDRFARQPKDYEPQPHPHFGQMSDADWMRLGYLHADHHLRQFGV